MPEESKQFIKGAFILTIAALIMKILSAVYRVPFQNIVGDIGFYIYQQAYPLYGIATVLASSGFSVVISKLIAEKVDQGRVEVERTLQAAFLTLLLVGCSLFLIVFFGAQPLARVMGDPLLTPVIQMIAFPYLFLPFFSVWRGYFQGVGNMVPTAISQVVEQFVRISVLLTVAILLVRSDHSLYEVGRGAWASSVAGSFVSLVLLYFFIRKASIHLLPMKKIAWSEWWNIGKTVLVQGTAICVSSLLLILFQLIDSLNVYGLLVQTGIEATEAKALKGVFDRGQPLLQLGTVAATAFSLALVPAVARAWHQGDHQLLQQKMATAIKISLLIGAGATVGLMNIMGPTNVMLFKNTEGSAVLAVLAIAIFLSSFIITYASVLQGIGHMFTPAAYIVIGVFIKYIGNVIFVPFLGIMGASIATLLGLFIIICLLVLKLNKHIQTNAPFMKWFYQVGLSLVGMTFFLQIWQLLFEWVGVFGRTWSTVIALTSVGAGGIIYIWFLFRVQFLTEKELHMLPFGSKLVVMADRVERKRKK